MDIVTAMMFLMMAIVLEQILVDFAQDVKNAWRNRNEIDWNWDN